MSISELFPIVLFISKSLRNANVELRKEQRIYPGFLPTQCVSKAKRIQALPLKLLFWTLRRHAMATGGFYESAL